MFVLTRRRALVALAVGIVLILVLSSYPGGRLGPSGYGQAFPTRVAGPAPTTSAHLAPANIGPYAPQCNPVQSVLLPYTPVAGVQTLYPLNPQMSQESPCTVDWYWAGGPAVIGTFNDELHLTFSSANSPSGIRWSLPMRLPLDGSGGIANFIHDVYAGMVVTGDNLSLYNQSLLQVIFTPGAVANGSLAYFVTLSVFSLHVGTANAGFCPSPNWGLNISWNNKYACELEMLGGGRGLNLSNPIPAGQFVNVTFNGAAKSGITVYVNDSTQKKFDSSYTLSAANVGRAYTPMYNSSCEDNCYLNWSEPFGNGFGADLAETAFNITLQDSINPVEIGSAEYYTGSGYKGDFANISLESASGACSGLSYTLDCAGLLQLPGSQYPYFQFNGTVLDLGSGSDYAWTVQDFNQYYQFESHGNPNDTVPFWLDELTNSSQAGFIGPNVGLDVSIRAADLGTISSVVLAYKEPDGTQGQINMTRTTGTSSFGVYKGTIPGSTTYGVVAYSILGTNHANETVRVPARSGAVWTVQREATIPRFTVSFQTVPDGCGRILYNGTLYLSHQAFTGPAGFYSARAYPCYPSNFKSWSATGIGINDSKSQQVNVVLKQNGTLTANFKLYRPHDTVDLYIATNNCGSILLNGTLYTTNTTGVSLLDAQTVPLSYGQCASNTFSGWVVPNPANLTILGGNPNTGLTPHGNGSITLTYVPSNKALSLVFQVIPSKCGGVLFRGAGYTNNVSVGVLQGVAYPIGPDPCPHYGLLRWATTLGVTVTGSNATGWNVSLQAPGTVTEYYYHLTEVTIITYPGYCGDVLWDGLPVYNGTILDVVNHSTHTVFAVPCAGFYFSGWFTSASSGSSGPTVRGNAATVDGSGIVEAVFHPGTPKDFVAFITDPGNCGAITFNGVNYVGSGYAQVNLNASSALVANPCPGFGFVSWEVGGVGITIQGIHTQTTHVWVNGSGSITAHFHPLEPLYVYTNPASCGSLNISGTSYTSGAQLVLPAPNVYPINVTPCAHYGFLYWVASSGISVANGTIVMLSAARLTAVFGPLTYQLVLTVTPGDCGGIKIGPNQYVNNTTVGEPFGNYTITPAPCTGFHLVKWVLSGGLTVSNLSKGWRLSVNASGGLLALYLPVPPSITLAAPGSAEAGSAVSLSVAIATQVPPYRYSYKWDFGDGTTATTAANFTTHTYAAIGTYFVTVTVVDPYQRTATTNATVKVLVAGTASNTSITLTALVAVGIGVVAVLAAVLLALRGSRPPREPETPSAPSDDRTDIEPTGSESEN